MEFLLDSSVIRNGLPRLTEQAASSGHRLVIPALIHAEQLFQDRRRRAEKGQPFDPAFFDDFCARHRGTLSVVPLTREEAEVAAERLYRRFPDSATWRNAKRAVARQCCLGTEPPDDQHATADCGAPVDLFIAALATPERPVITHDVGFEWRDWPVGAVISVRRAFDLMGAP